MQLSQITDVWKSVEKDYLEGEINSERCLQSCIFHHLRNSDGKFSVFVEPGLFFEGNAYRMKPDIVICRDNVVAGVMELKFMPHWYPKYNSDIQKFERLWIERKQEHPIKIDPSSGEWTKDKYRIGNQTWFFFVVIAQHDAEAIDYETVSDKLSKSLRNRFVHMSGRIDKRNGVEFDVTPQ